MLTVTVIASESAGHPYSLVAVEGEADAANRDELRGALDAEIALRPAKLVLDLSGLSFMDSAALHVILLACRALDREGGTMTLAAPRRAISTVLSLTQADKLVQIRGSVAEAAGV